MLNRECLLALFLFAAASVSCEEHELIYNEDFVYYDECRISVSPRQYLHPVRAFAQVQKPCNGTLLWTYPKSHLTLTIANLENDSFTLCFEKKAIEENLVRSIKQLDARTNQTHDAREFRVNSGVLLCSASQGNRASVVIEAQPLYAGVHLRYAMYNERHPWTTGPFPGWERSEKYLYGPVDRAPMKRKKIHRNRQKVY